MRVSLLAAGLAASLLTLSACKRTEPAAAPADAGEEAAASRRGGILPGAAQVTDVEAREVR